MARYTDGPYHLTLKTNGCLILVSALSETELVVASKHSLGTTIESEPETGAVKQAGEGQKTEVKSEAKAESSKSAQQKAAASFEPSVEAVTAQLDEASFESKNQLKKAKKALAKAHQSVKGKGKEEERVHSQERANDDQDHKQSLAHAEVGRHWLHKMLVTKGLSEVDLARRLWKDNCTAVFEVSSIMNLAKCSSAMMNSKSMSSQLQLIKPVSTYMASTTTLPHSTLKIQQSSLPLQKSLASSQHLTSLFQRYSMSRSIPTRSPNRALGKAI